MVQLYICIHIQNFQSDIRISLRFQSGITPSHSAVLSGPWMVKLSYPARYLSGCVSRFGTRPDPLLKKRMTSVKRWIWGPRILRGLPNTAHALCTFARWIRKKKTPPLPTITRITRCRVIDGEKPNNAQKYGKSLENLPWILASTLSHFIVHSFWVIPSHLSILACYNLYITG